MISRLAVAAIVASALVLVGCDGNGIKRSESTEHEEKASVSDRFLCDSSLYRFETVVDDRTGVTYLIWKSTEVSTTSTGGITVLVNRDGSPVISEDHAQGNQNASHEKTVGGADGDAA